MDRGNQYNALIMVTEADYIRLKPSHKRIVDNLPVRKLIFVGSKAVGQRVEEEFANDERVEFLDEDDLLTFSDVNAVMADVMKEIYPGNTLPRGVTGWYYQQFLKMKYADICGDTFYMTWDGDTVPCKAFSMFSETNGLPFFDVKEEFHPEYFITLERLFPGFRKVLRQSFISEHMLYRVDIMKELISEIEKNEALEGTSFWEKIIRSIEPERMKNACFSEFETYGTYVALRHFEQYRIREWHSFRLGAEFFEQETISQRDYDWLSRDFFAISFEKNQSVREDHRNLFNNPEYQAKLSAKRMLQIAQEEFEEGYREIWSEDAVKTNEFGNVY